MPPASSSDVKLEIGHVLFIDIVGYSKLLITEQREQMQKLREIVRGTEQFRLAEAEGKLLRLPTGDGGALVFRTSPEAPVLCALEISKELQKHPELRVRMGIHSGPVNEITDLNEQANIAGAGINIAQRVMDCGDSGHILLSKHVADDLEQYPEWRSHLHDLGECEVKHGVRVGIVNLSRDGVGNAAAPKKFQAIKKRRAHVRWATVAVALVVLGAIVGGTFFFSHRPMRSMSGIVDKSIAVLPFENLSEEKQNEYFADGVQDEILTDLAKIADLKVISRASVMQYKSGLARNLRKIGEELGVAHVVEGSVQRAANKIRVNAQLIDARNDAHLWAQTYDRDLADVFAIQSEIAKAIADQLQAKLSPQEKSAIERAPTKDVAAFDLYTRARNLYLTAWNSDTGRADMLRATDLLNQAVTRDPSFFDAYCQLAQTELAIYFLGWDHTPARLARGETAVQAAARLRPDAGETHFVRAQNRYHGYLDYDGALAELELARQSIPGNSDVAALQGYVERRQGRWNESVRDLERSIELDPRNVLTLQQTAVSYACLRRYPEAKAILGRVLAIQPDDAEAKTSAAWFDLDWKAATQPLHQAIDSIRATNPAAMPTIASWWFNCAMAERDAAAAQSAVGVLGQNPITSLGFHDNLSFSSSFLQGLIGRLMKDEGKAREAFTAARAEQEKLMQTQPDYAPVMCVLALIDAGLGRKEEALHEGRRAVELLPLEKDEHGGIAMVKYLSITAAWVGDKDLAIAQLGIATSHPCDLSYGQLKLLPYWDPLRSDPRFEKIVASLAPK